MKPLRFIYVFVALISAIALSNTAFARGEKILCQGRGSAANSAVCFCLGITEVDPGRMATLVERYSDKPLSDGLSVDTAGGVYITDVEHSAIFRVSPTESLSTLIQSQDIRWPDALSFGPDGYLYVADSALPELILKSTEHIKTQGPFRIFRFQPGFEGVPGQ